MAESLLTLAPKPASLPPTQTARSGSVASVTAPETEFPAPHPLIGTTLPRVPASIPVDPPNESQHLPPLPLQRKLAIGSAADPLEAEAEAVAQSAAGSGNTPSPRVRRTPSPRLTEAPPAVHHVLRSPGQPLDASTRHWAEPALQSDFRNVRVHSGTQAAESAAAIHARAYTVGSSIVLGPGAPSSGPDFRRLLAHELTHVVQQGMAPPRPASPAATQSDLQSPVAPSPVTLRAAAPLIQRDEAVVPDTSSTDLGVFTEALVEVLSAPARAAGDTAYKLVRSTWHGFLAEIKSHSGDIIDKVKGRLKEFATSGTQLLSFFPKYWWGLIKGIFSPITGLFDLAVLAVKLEEIGRHALGTAWENRDKISADAADLGASMRRLGGKAKTAVGGFFSHPVDTIIALGPLLDQAQKEANLAAERGGHTLAGKLIEAADKPIPDLAETGGEIIGTVVVNVALFVLTDGIGDAISQIATKLGEVGSWLSKLGKGAQVLGRIAAELGEVLGTVGGWVTRAEAFIGKIAGAILKPLEPVLEEFGGLMTKLRSFLRDVLGVAEKAESEEAAALAKAAGGSNAPPTKPKPDVPKPPEPPVTDKPPVPQAKPVPPAKKPLPQEPKAPPPDPKAPLPDEPKAPAPEPRAPLPETKPGTPPPETKPATPPPENTPSPAPDKPAAPAGPAPDPAPPQPKPTEPAPKDAPDKTPAPGKDLPPEPKKPADPASPDREPAPNEELAPPEKEPTPPEEEPPAKSPAERAKRVEDIRKEMAANQSEIDRLNKEFKAAEERAQQSWREADSKPKYSDDQARLKKNALKNQRKADRLRDQRNALQSRNEQLARERSFLLGPNTWQDAEDFLRREFNGQKKTFHVNDELGDRNIDCFTPDRISRECKFGGPHDLSEFVENEIKKDVALRDAGKVGKVEWHFYKDPSTAGIGPKSRLAKALKDAGIDIFFHTF